MGERTHTPKRQKPAETPGRRVSPTAAFAVLAIVCVFVAVGYVAWAALQRRPTLSAAGVPPSHVVPTPAAGTSQGASLPAVSASPDPLATTGRLIFQNVIRDEGYAKVSYVPLDDPGAERTVSDLTCERVYMTADEGLCLVPEQGLVSTYYAITFGDDFVPRDKTELAGAPSRARISSDGRYGAATVFVFGHSYADADFSTQTTIIDMATGTIIGELEKFSVTKDAVAITSPDVNYWGVTFADDSDTFYATLRTQGKTYLVKGSVSGRAMEVLHENVECPSLSPDGTRIVYKKRVDALFPSWRLTVLDLSSMTETPLAETRSIDDQAEWLDDDSVVYADGKDIWKVQADGGGTPSLFVTDALSPAVIAPTS